MLKSRLLTALVAADFTLPATALFRERDELLAALVDAQADADGHSAEAARA